MGLNRPNASKTKPVIIQIAHPVMKLKMNDSSRVRFFYLAVTSEPNPTHDIAQRALVKTEYRYPGINSTELNYSKGVIYE